MKNKLDKNVNVPVCPNCGSKQTLFRLVKKSSICRRCGTEWTAKKNKEK